MPDHYEEVVQLVIRPPRRQYTTEQLGPVRTLVGDTWVNRHDEVIMSQSGLRLQCSHWAAEDTHEWLDCSRRPCVVYLHGNSSSRMSALEILPVVVPLGASLLAFDFGGCGMSEGEYVSLGWFESEQLRDVLAHVRATKKVSAIALWGRSMGAVTALIYTVQDQSIAALILDSAFSSLTQLMTEVSQRKAGSAFAGIGLRFLRSSVLERAGFDIELVQPIDQARSCVAPAMFAHGRRDDFVEISHAHTLRDQYGGVSHLVEFGGDHYSERPPEMYKEAKWFLQEHLLTWHELPTHSDGTKVPRGSLHSRQANANAEPDSNKHEWLSTRSAAPTATVADEDSFLTRLLSCFDSDSVPRNTTTRAEVTVASPTRDSVAAAREARERRARMRPDRGSDTGGLTRGKTF